VRGGRAIGREGGRPIGPAPPSHNLGSPPLPETNTHTHTHTQKTRLAKFYVPLTDAEQRAAEADVFRATSAARDAAAAARSGPVANILDWGPHKLVVRRYAGLSFAACIDGADPELAALEAIHLFVEVLDHYFGAVCELDLVFNFHKVRAQEGEGREIERRGGCGWWPSLAHEKETGHLTNLRLTTTLGPWPFGNAMKTGLPHPGRVHPGRRDPGDE
jgi:AP-2 complex subunit sigma-1